MCNNRGPANNEQESDVITLVLHKTAEGEHHKNPIFFSM